MRCGRTWAFEEKLERRADHQSTKSAVTVRPSPADITLTATAERRHAHPVLRITEVRARPKRQQQLSCRRRTGGVHVCNSQCADRGNKSI